MHLLLSWLVLALAVLAAAAVVPGVKVKGFAGALVVAAAFGVLNWLVGWFFFVLLGIATLGLGFLFAFLTRWVVNAILLKLVDAATDYIDIKGFVPALWAAGLMSLLATVAHWVLR